MVGHLRVGCGVQLICLIPKSSSDSGVSGSRRRGNGEEGFSDKSWCTFPTLVLCVLLIT